MALNYIWISFFVIGAISALYEFFILHQHDIFQTLITQLFETTETGVQISFGLVGMLSLFMGFMLIAERAGLIQGLSKLVSPFFSKLFPSIPKDSPAIGNMILNFSANLLGLDNAATPFGLKAMENLQDHNQNKDTASDSQILFVVLHASGLTLIPMSIIAQRVILHSAQPTSIFIPCMLATYFATIAGIIFVGIKQKLNLLHPIVLSVIVGLTTLLVAFIFFVPQHQLVRISSIGSNFLIFFLFVFFILAGLKKRINVFETFIEGAKKGFQTSIQLIPYLIAMLVAISVFKTSGIFNLLVEGLQKLFQLLGMNTDFCAALPTALMKPISGSGARAMMIDTMKTYGPDSFVGNLACVFQGSSDTTLYIVALYFGTVQIKNIRYTIALSLLADFIGIIAAIIISYLFFHPA